MVLGASMSSIVTSPARHILEEGGELGRIERDVAVESLLRSRTASPGDSSACQECTTTLCGAPIEARNDMKDKVQRERRERSDIGRGWWGCEAWT